MQPPRLVAFANSLLERHAISQLSEHAIVHLYPREEPTLSPHPLPQDRSGRGSAWGEFVNDIDRGWTDAVIAVLPTLGGSKYRVLINMQDQVPLTPVILGTCPDPENLRRLKDGVFADVLFPLEFDQNLWRSVQSALDSRLFVLAAYLIRRTPTDDRALVEAMAAGLNHALPPRDVTSLSHLIGRGRRTLHERWRLAFPRGLTPKDFLDWGLLLRAVMLRRKHGSWARVASRLAIDPRRLNHAARRSYGVDQNALSSLRRQDWLARLEDVLGMQLDVRPPSVLGGARPLVPPPADSDESAVPRTFL